MLRLLKKTSSQPLRAIQEVTSASLRLPSRKWMYLKLLLVKNFGEKTSMQSLPTHLKRWSRRRSPRPSIAVMGEPSNRPKTCTRQTLPRGSFKAWRKLHLRSKVRSCRYPVSLLTNEPEPISTIIHDTNCIRGTCSRHRCMVGRVAHR